MDSGTIDFSDLKRVLYDLTGQFQWWCFIARVGNGYFLKYNEEHEAGIKESRVIEDDDQDELKSHEELLYEVMEHFNFWGSKHDPERLFIIRKKQKP